MHVQYNRCYLTGLLVYYNSIVANFGICNWTMPLCSVIMSSILKLYYTLVELLYKYITKVVVWMSTSA